MEKRYFTKEGQTVWIHLNGSAGWNQDGSLRHFIAQIENITDSKHAENELEERERKFKSIFNSTFQFIGFLDPDGTLLEVNETALDFSGTLADTGLGLSICRKIVEQHRGNIWAESAMDNGSVFHFTGSKELKDEAVLSLKYHPIQSLQVFLKPFHLLFHVFPKKNQSINFAFQQIKMVIELRLQCYPLLRNSDRLYHPN